jgi:hypothetical protein
MERPVKCDHNPVLATKPVDQALLRRLVVVKPGRSLVLAILGGSYSESGKLAAFPFAAGEVWEFD